MRIIGILMPICKVHVEPWFHHLNGNIGGIVATIMSNIFKSHHLERVLRTLSSCFQVQRFLAQLSVPPFFLSLGMASGIRSLQWLHIMRDLHRWS